MTIGKNAGKAGSDSMFSRVKAAFRDFGSDDFTVVWPKDFKGDTMRKSIVAGLGAVIMVALGVKAEAADWGTDFATASANASKSGLYMLLDFTGSDWCGWCMKLDEEVFSKSQFRTFAKQHLVCVLVDFPRQKKQSKKVKEQNAELAKKYAIRGYPTVVILSPEGDLVGKTGYQEGGVKKYVKDLKEMIAAYEKEHPKKVTEKQPPSNKPDTGDGT